MDRATPDIDGSKAEGDISITSSEIDSESPLARRRDDQSGDSTTGQDNSPMATRDLAKAGLSSLQCSSSSSSPQTEKITSASVLEPQAAHKTRKTGKTCSEDEDRLDSSSTNKHGMRTDREEAAATQQRNVPTMSMAFSLGATTERLSVLNDNRGDLMEEKEGESDGRRMFRAKINPASNNQAEEELRKHIRYKVQLALHATESLRDAFVV